MVVLCAAFVPLPEHALMYALTLIIAVTIQEAARYGAYVINQYEFYVSLIIPSNHMSSQYFLPLFKVQVAKFFEVHAAPVLSLRCFMQGILRNCVPS